MSGKYTPALSMELIVLASVLGLAGSIVAMRGTDSICSTLQSAGASLPIGHKTSSPELKCSDDQRLVSIQVNVHTTKASGRVILWTCPNVHEVELQLAGKNVHFVSVPQNVTLTSCLRGNDTAYLRKSKHRARFSLHFGLDRLPSLPSRITYFYSIHDSSATINRSSDVENTLSDDHQLSEQGIRWRRSVSEKRSSATFLDSTTMLSRGSLTTNWTAICGKSQSCIRFGREGCGHLQCDYMLTYHVVNTTDVHIQLSARSHGWVAVGFSSDDKMGGDDVIGCKRNRPMSLEVVSMCLSNTVGHARPREKENRLELLDSRVEDDHIYCHVKCSLKFGKREDESDLDLTNDWYQLYAFGDVDGSGAILQHSEIPRVSQNKITMLRVFAMQETSPAPCPVLSVLFVLVTLVLSFAGSLTGL